MQPSAQVFVSNIKSQLLPDLIGKLGWVYWEGGWEEGILGCDGTRISEDKCPLSEPSLHCSAQSGSRQQWTSTSVFPGTVAWPARVSLQV